MNFLVKKFFIFVLLALSPCFDMVLGNEQKSNGNAAIWNSRFQFELNRRLQQTFQIENLRAKGNGKAMKVLLPKLVFWRKQRQSRIERQRMLKCINVLNVDICNNRGSFYQWGKIIAQRIRNGEF